MKDPQGFGPGLGTIGQSARPDPREVLERISKPRGFGDAVSGAQTLTHRHNDHDIENLLTCDDEELVVQRQRLLDRMLVNNTQEIRAVNRQGEWFYNQIGELRAGVVALYELLQKLESYEKDNDTAIGIIERRVEELDAKKVDMPMTTEEALEDAKGTGSVRPIDLHEEDL